MERKWRRDIIRQMIAEERRGRKGEHHRGKNADKFPTLSPLGYNPSFPPFLSLSLSLRLSGKLTRDRSNQIRRLNEASQFRAVSLRSPSSLDRDARSTFGQHSVKR